MELKPQGNITGRRQGKFIVCSLALLMLTGCSAGTSQTDAAPLSDTQLITAEAEPIAALPAPAGTTVNPDTQPATVGRADPDTQPAVVPGVKFANQVVCGTATMDLPTNLQQVSQYGSGDITTEYASADGKWKVEINCRDRKASDDPNTDFQNTKNALTKTPTYTYNKNNRWVITGPGLLCAGNCPGSDSSEYYKATWYSNDKIFSMLWEYPTFDDAAISPTIDHVYHSFKWNGGTSTPVAPGQTQQPINPSNTAKTTTKLSLREGPDCNSTRLAWIPNGTTVKVERGAVGDETGWYLVEYEGKTGWASGYYLDGDTITYHGAKLCQN